ncbi:mitochondrial import inner membrane translocase subunit tim23 [Phyllosticta citricarpa]|uniref:Mitochondrial import inner membrane translocase subunit TIM23 n=3 Tax=Phyllosticta TaxID=121621 RepID=A0ABR1M3N6_9PEZI
MAIWDAFTGPKPHSTTTSSPDAQASQSSYASPAAPDVSSFLSTPGAFDPSSLHPLAGLNEDTLDYLTIEEGALTDLPGARHGALPSRGWSDDLCYGTGTTYLTALSLGGAWGLAEGLNKTTPNMAPRLKLNAVLNAVTRRGPFLGNSAGIVAMVYNIFNSTIGHYRGKHDATNSIMAGAMSGALFKCTRGLKPMAISSAIVASVAGTWALIRKTFF